jgi:hypothetical protein
VVVGVLAAVPRPVPLAVVPRRAPLVVALVPAADPAEDSEGRVHRPVEGRVHPLAVRRMGHPAVRADPRTRRRRRVPAARAVLRKPRAATAAVETPRLRPRALPRPVGPTIPLPGRVDIILRRLGVPAVPAVNRLGVVRGVTPIRGRRGFPTT